MSTSRTWTYNLIPCAEASGRHIVLEFLTGVVKVGQRGASSEVRAGWMVVPVLKASIFDGALS